MLELSPATLEHHHTRLEPLAEAHARDLATVGLEAKLAAYALDATRPRSTA